MRLCGEPKSQCPARGVTHGGDASGIYGNIIRLFEQLGQIASAPGDGRSCIGIWAGLSGELWAQAIVRNDNHKVLFDQVVYLGGWDGGVTSEDKASTMKDDN